MQLIISKKIYAELKEAAVKDAPIEACGLLAGRNDCVEKFYPLTNTDADEEHFSMLPAEQFAAVKDMRAHGLEMLAIWHSHPASPPRMSDEDLRLAFTPGVMHVILSLAVPEQQAVCGYKLCDEGHEKIEIVITDE